MSSRFARLFIALAASAAFAGGIALPATQAVAEATPTLSAQPATALDNGSKVTVTLGDAGSYEGDTVVFEECNETLAAASQSAHNSTYPDGCASSLASKTITNGAASASVTVVGGAAGDDCRVDNNGECDIVALVWLTNNATKIAATPAIDFEAVQTPEVTAQPSTDLDDGDSVAVTVSHIPSTASSTVYLVECNTTAVTNQQDYFEGSCVPIGPFAGGAVTNHSYSTSVHVVYGGRSGNQATTGCDETTDCVIAALDWDNETVLATIPISFEAPPVTFTVTPSTGLKDTQFVAVATAGVPAALQGYDVYECNADYAANHGGYTGLNVAGCLDLGSPDAFTDHATTTYVQVVDGALNGGSSGPVCDHATNGQCVIVLLRDAGTNPPGHVQEESAYPISFRPPVTGPGSLTVRPAAGLFPAAPITVSTAPDMADGLTEVDVLECSPATVKASGYTKGCHQIGEVPVKNNAVSSRQVRVQEGKLYQNISYTRWINCDHTHQCEIGLATDTEHGNSTTFTSVSSMAPITFRNPNQGTPTVRLSDASGLTKSERITATLAHVPDLDQDVGFELCNVKAGHGKYVADSNCRFLTPGGSIVVIYDGAGFEKFKVIPGSVGETNRGKKIYCNSSTNGQCAIVAVSSSGRTQKFIAKSRTITFAKP